MRHRAILVGLGLVVAGVLPAGAQEKGEGPSSLILSYKCPPERRAAFRAHMEKAGVARFEGWKRDGVVRDYRLLFSSYVNAATWDMLAILSFDHFVDAARWRDIEKTMPGGLDPDGLALGAPVTTYGADLTWQGAAARGDPARAVYVVIPYTYEERAQYKSYVDGYVIPQVKGWLAEGVVTSYAMYLNQNEAGEPWDSLFVLEYRDLRGLALRRATVTKVRAALQANAEWKRLSDTKQEIRKEGQVVIADAILPR